MKFLLNKIEFIIAICLFVYFCFMFFLMLILEQRSTSPPSDITAAAMGVFCILAGVGYSGGILIARRKKYLSIITFSEEGIDVTYLGKSYFQSTWAELEQIGTFVKFLGRFPCIYIYFSKKPFDFEKESVSALDRPNDRRVKMLLSFLDSSIENHKTYREILKYVDKGKIIDHGFQK